jgi:hypothetical protein
MKKTTYQEQERWLEGKLCTIEIRDAAAVLATARFSGTTSSGSNARDLGSGLAKVLDTCK